MLTTFYLSVVEMFKEHFLQIAIYGHMFHILVVLKDVLHMSSGLYM